MKEHERLREELLDLERNLRRERGLRQEAEAMVAALGRLAAAPVEVAPGEVLAVVAELLGAAGAFIVTADEGTSATTLAAWGGSTEPGRVWLPGPLLGRVAPGRPAVVVFDPTAVPELRDAPSATVREAGSLLVAPLRGGEHPAWLLLTHAVRGRFGPRQAALACRFTPLFAEALAQVELRRALAGEHDFTKAVLDTSDALVVVLHPSGRVLGFNRACERLTGYRADEVIGQAFHRLVLPGQRPGIEGMIERLVATGDGESAESTWQTRSGEARLIAWSNTALRVGDGPVSAVIATGIDITAQRRLEEELRRAALTDPLTGLSNRAALRQQLTTMLARMVRWSGYRCALLVLDLDGFKAVNDGWGHAAGDRVLEQTARRLLGCVRLVDTVARLGGDEFAVLLDGMSSAREAAVVASRIRRAIAAPFVLDDGRPVRIGVSIGRAVASTPAPEPDALLRRADDAMYRDKAARKARRREVRPLREA